MSDHWIDGEMLAFDLETTGVDKFEDVPVSFALVWFENRTVVRTRAEIVNPGRPIPEGASAIHGISTERAMAEGMDLEAAVEEISLALLAASKRGAPVVGYNLAYDLTMTDARLKALGRPGLVEMGWRGPVLDPLVIERFLKGVGSFPLDKVCQTYGVVNAAAHDAAGDAIAAAEVLFAQSEQNRRILATGLDRLTEVQVGWHRGWAEGMDDYLRRKQRPHLDPSDFDWPLSGQQLSFG